MPFFEVSENCSFHLYNIGCLSMIYRLKYAKSESNFDADFEHPTLQGALLIANIPRALPWAMSFCPFRACWEFISIASRRMGNYSYCLRAYWGIIPLST